MKTQSQRSPSGSLPPEVVTPPLAENFDNHAGHAALRTTAKVSLTLKRVICFSVAVFYPQEALAAFGHAWVLAVQSPVPALAVVGLAAGAIAKVSHAYDEAYHALPVAKKVARFVATLPSVSERAAIRSIDANENVPRNR